MTSASWPDKKRARVVSCKSPSLLSCSLEQSASCSMLTRYQRGAASPHRHPQPSPAPGYAGSHRTRCPSSSNDLTLRIGVSLYSFLRHYSMGQQLPPVSSLSPLSPGFSWVSSSSCSAGPRRRGLSPSRGIASEDGLSISVWVPARHYPILVHRWSSLRSTRSLSLYHALLPARRFLEPLDIRQWQEQTGHDLVFDAGLPRELCLSRAALWKRPLAGELAASTWLGLFVAEPTEDRSRRARVLDLTFDTLDEQHIPIERLRSRYAPRPDQKISVPKPGNAHIRLSSLNTAMGIFLSSKRRKWCHSMPLENV